MRYFYLFWWNVRIWTTKFFCQVRTFHSIYHVDVINLRVSSYLCELRGACSYILGFAPTRKFKPSHLRRFYFSVWNVRIQTTKFFCRVRILPSVWREMRPTCGAFLTICLRCTWQIYSLSPRPEISNRRICGGFTIGESCDIIPGIGGEYAKKHKR